MSLMSIKASTEAISTEQKRLVERKRNILVLINSYLIENGYVGAAERLQSEGGAALSKFAAADNIDLALILSEYESYYEMRFDKKPKLVRKLADSEEISAPGGSSNKNGKSRNTVDSGASRRSGGSAASGKLPTISNSASRDEAAVAGGGPADIGFGVQGSSISNVQQQTSEGKAGKEPETVQEESRMLKPPPQFGGDPELRQLAAVISRDIYQDSPNVRFEDIVRLDEAKRLLVEAVQLPLRFPTLFTGILRPWKGILLHGPPGTGKTLLAKAVATECNTTFFNISASTLVSKWRGDSEKLVRVLFEVARYHAPSTIFLDEIDSILSSRGGDGGGGGGGNEHEASRRMKTELLIQMDGVKGVSQSSDQVFVMAASNLPWDLDIAVLRRLEKRVLVPLPESEAREVMFHKLLADRCAEDMDFNQVAEKTPGYSGADIELVAREAAMMPVRRIMHRLNQLDTASSSTASSSSSVTAFRAYPPPPAAGSTSANTASGAGRGAGVVGGSGHRAVAMSVAAKQQLQLRADEQRSDIEQLMKADPVSLLDVLTALQTTKPSSDGNIERYEQWQRDFGSV